MKKIFFGVLLTFLGLSCGGAHAQISGAPYNPANVAITGGTIRGISDLGMSTTNPAFTMINSSAAANARAWDMVISGGSLLFRVKSDDGATTLSWMNVIRGSGVNVSTLQIIPDTFVSGLIVANGGLRMIPGTVASLPACDANSRGAFRTVSDANTPTYNATLVGGGAVVVVAFCNGTNWTAH